MNKQSITTELKIIHEQAEKLLDEAAVTLLPFKIDRQAFAYDPLFQRYRKNTRRLQEIQQKVRQLKERESEIINRILKTTEQQ